MRVRDGFHSDDEFDRDANSLDSRLVARWVGLLLAAGIIANLLAVASRAAGMPLFD